MFWQNFIQSKIRFRFRNISDDHRQIARAVRSKKIHRLTIATITNQFHDFFCQSSSSSASSSSTTSSIRLSLNNLMMMILVMVAIAESSFRSIIFNLSLHFVCFHSQFQSIFSLLILSSLRSLSYSLHLFRSSDKESAWSVLESDINHSETIINIIWILLRRNFSSPLDQHRYPITWMMSLKSAAPNSNNILNSSNNNTPKLTYPCGECSFEAQSARQLSRHKAVTHTQNALKCVLCPFVTVSWKYVQSYELRKFIN